MEIVKFRTQILHFNVTPKELRKRRLRQLRLYTILFYTLFHIRRMVFLMRDAVIVSACRTAIGSFNGQFADITAVDLGIAAVTEAIKRAGVPVDQIDEVIMGHVLQAGCGENTARQVALHSGIPQEVPAFTLNKLCGSGMRAISLASQQIKLGDADIIVLAVWNPCPTLRTPSQKAAAAIAWVTASSKTFFFVTA